MSKTGARIASWGDAARARARRRRCTPIPLTYSRHTSRFFTLYAITLPYALLQAPARTHEPPLR